MAISQNQASVKLLSGAGAYDLKASIRAAQGVPKGDPTVLASYKARAHVANTLITEDE